MRAFVAGLALIALHTEAVADTTDGSYISWINPLYFTTAFTESGKVLGISMACGSSGLPTCEAAFDRLHILTDSSNCRDGFFVALIDQSDFAEDEPAKAASETRPWLLFSFLAGKYGRINLIPTFPEDTIVIDCTYPYVIMMDARERYLQE